MRKVMDYEFRKFYGFDGEDVKRWLEKLEVLFSLVGIDRDSRIASAFLAFYLAGYAETWYSTLPEAKRDDFWCLKDALLDKFSLSDIDKFNLRCELNSRKQGKSEPVEYYAEFVFRTAQRIEISDSELTFYFVNGLRHDLKREVLMRTPKTYCEAFNIAKHTEAVEQIITNQVTVFESVESEYAEYADPDNRNFERAADKNELVSVSCAYNYVLAKMGQRKEVPKSMFLTEKIKDKIRETKVHDQVEIDARTSIQSKEINQEVCADSATVVSNVPDIYKEVEIEGVNEIAASALYEVKSYFTRKIFEARNNFYEAGVELDPEKIVGNTIENFIDDNDTSNGTDICFSSNSGGSKVDWFHQSPVSLDAEPGFPYRIDCKVMQSEELLAVLFLMILLSVARKRAEGHTRRFNVCEKLLLRWKSNPILPKELLWLWRKHERQKL